MDRSGRIGAQLHMRAILAFGLLIALTACSGDPRSYGITGPGPRAVPAPPQGVLPDAPPPPGVPTSGTYYGPTNAPLTGDTGFWGYN